LSPGIAESPRWFITLGLLVMGVVDQQSSSGMAQPVKKQRHKIIVKWRIITPYF